ITFWPLREVVLEAAGERGYQGVLDVLAGEEDRESMAAHVGVAIGLIQESASGVGLFAAVRRFLEALARRQPPSRRRRAIPCSWSSYWPHSATSEK
ncbi:MAG: hypothetical protein M3O70_18740, partial [Actinomycetota bacterium]|nr:hypothetical protein [Actinomycetota bacterium]